MRNPIHLISCLLFYPGLIILSPAGRSQPSAIEIYKTNLKTCNPESLCLEVSADKAYGSTFSQIYVFKKPIYKLLKNQKVIRQQKVLKAILDFSNDQIVMVQQKGSHLEEVVFQISSLKRKKFMVRR